MYPLWAALVAISLSVFFITADIGRNTKKGLDGELWAMATDMMAYADCVETYHEQNAGQVAGFNATPANLNGTFGAGVPYCPMGYVVPIAPTWGNVIDVNKNVFVFPRDDTVLNNGFRALQGIKQMRNRFNGTTGRLGIKQAGTNKRIDPWTGVAGPEEVRTEVPDGAAYITFKAP